MPMNGFLSPGTTLSVQIYMIVKEGSGKDALNLAYELALIVMVTILVLNILSSKLANFFSPLYKKVSFLSKIKEILHIFGKIFNKIKNKIIKLSKKEAKK